MGRISIKHPWAIGAWIAWLVLATPVAHAAPGYTYDLIFVNGGQGPGQYLKIEHAAINNAGEVAFTTREDFGLGGSSIFRVFVAVAGMPPQQIFEGTSNSSQGQGPGPFWQDGPGLGINDDGIVAVPLVWNNFDTNGNFLGQDSGYGLFDPGAGAVGEIRGVAAYTGRLNINLEMADLVIGTGGFRHRVTSGGAGTFSTPSTTNPGTLVQVNDAGSAASVGRTTSGQTAVFYSTPPGLIQAVGLGDANGAGWNPAGIVPGLNEAGWMSHSLQDSFGPESDPRVVLINPSGELFIVADTAGAGFVNFWQPRQVSAEGVSLNNLNRVSFAGQLLDGSDFLWVGDASGDPPRLVAEPTIEFSDGTRLEGIGFANDVTNHGANSQNDRGEIVVIAPGNHLDANGIQLHSSARALFVAKPTVGSEPGNPILPEPGDALPQPTGGWRLRGRCWRETLQDIPGSCLTFGGIGASTPRTWYDPPIAVGYDFSIDSGNVGSFESVLIPVALGGGDAEFVLQANGAFALLPAGAAFGFSSISPDPVRTFRVFGIEESEAIDSADPAAFVTGLTFEPGTDEDVAFTMIPVAVPEPGLIPMLVAGVAVLVGRGRRRRAN